MTNNRAIHSAATSEANIFTHQKSTKNRLAMATHSTSQSSKNQMIGVATPRVAAKGCSNFWNLKRDLSTGSGADCGSEAAWGGAADSGSVGNSGGKGVGTRNSGVRVKQATMHYTP